MDGVAIRRAEPHDLVAAADVMWASRRANVPAIPPLIHEHLDVRKHIAGRPAAGCEVWVAVTGGAIVAMMVLRGRWVDQLYVHPDHTACGIGADLLEQAKRERPDGIDLWTFRSNEGARRFYARHGFVEVDRTEGDNEEGMPDVRLRWTPSRRSNP